MPLFTNEPKIEGVSVKEDKSSVNIHVSESHVVALKLQEAWRINLNRIYYCEIFFKSCSSASDSYIGIGLTKEDFPSKYNLPGSTSESYGYRHDGVRRIGNGFLPKWKPYGKEDVVGIGLYSATGELFYTLNGEILGTIAILTKDIPWHLTLGLNRSMEVEVEFKFKRFLIDILSLPNPVVPFLGELETTCRWGFKALILFIHDLPTAEQEKLKTELTTAAKQLRTKYQVQCFYSTSLSDRVSQEVQQHVKVTESPLLFSIDFLQERNKYVTTSNLTADGIERFVEDIAASKLIAYV